MERGKQFGQYLHEEPTQGELLLCLLLLGVTSANPSHSWGASCGTTRVTEEMFDNNAWNKDGAKANVKNDVTIWPACSAWVSFLVGHDEPLKKFRTSFLSFHSVIPIS